MFGFRARATASRPETPLMSTAPVQRAAWQDLPPLGTHAPIAPIAPLDPFVSSLATSSDPSFLEPLGHAVDPDGPSGTVEGIAHTGPPVHVSGGPELPVAPAHGPASRVVQRAVALPRLLFGAVGAAGAVGAPARRRSARPTPHRRSPQSTSTRRR